MSGRLIEVAKSAYQYPLLIKQLLHTPLIQHRDQEIVYRDLKRVTYGDLGDRIIRLIKAHLKTYADEGVISKYGIPQTIKFVDQLERTSVGKINKKELRAKYTDVA